MNQSVPTVGHSSGESHGSFGSYSLGFILAVGLTIASFAAVMVPGLPKTTIVPLILALAVVQMFVHLYFFLHLNFDSEQRWNVVAFAFAAMTVVILVFGSLWIMSNVSNNMNPDHTLAGNHMPDM